MLTARVHWDKKLTFCFLNLLCISKCETFTKSRTKLTARVHQEKQLTFSFLSLLCISNNHKVAVSPLQLLSVFIVWNQLFLKFARGFILISDGSFTDSGATVTSKNAVNIKGTIIPPVVVSLLFAVGGFCALEKKSARKALPGGLQCHPSLYSLNI